jgi:MFS family permease
MFWAFSFANFRWFTLGQVVNMTGFWLQHVALGWLIYRLTGSSLMLGLAGGMSLLPSFFLAPIAGVMADSFDRRKILIVVQLLTATHAILLALLVWSGFVAMWNILLLSVFIGLIHGFDWPTRQSLIVDMVDDRKALGNAIALNSTSFNLARLLGPLLGGLILAMANELACFIVSASMACFALLFILKLRTPIKNAGKVRRKILAELNEGVTYAMGNVQIRRGILLAALTSAFVMPYMALMPLFAAEVFQGEAGLYGVLAAIPAGGAICGGLFLATRRQGKDLSMRIFIVSILASISLILFSQSTWLPLSMVALFVLGGTMIMTIASINTQLQLLVEESKRGRVMSFFVMAFMGAMPLGYFAYGSIAEKLGAPATVMIAGMMALIGYFYLNRKLMARKPTLKESISDGSI